MPMNAADQLTIARILKVNHAGEYGAIRIYRAQAWVARRIYRRIYPELVAFLEDEASPV
jgi:ubiquinone biosynthesis monooxygenase Coq7